METIKMAMRTFADLLEVRNLQFGLPSRNLEALVQVFPLPAPDELKSYFSDCIPSRTFGWIYQFYSIESLQLLLQGGDPHVRLIPLGCVPIAEKNDGSLVCYSLREECVILVDCWDFNDWTALEHSSTKRWPDLQTFFLNVLSEAQDLAESY